MKFSYFNKGVIFGKVKEFNARDTKNNGKPYLEMQFMCPNAQYGDVTAHGRLWGEDVIKEFQAAHLANPAMLWRFQGMLTQFEWNSKRLTGFHLFKFDPAPEGSVARAVFILRGVCMGRDLTEDKIMLKYVKTDVRPEELAFELSGCAAQALKGDVLDVKGVLKDKDAFFGGSGAIVAGVEEVKCLGKEEEAF